MAIVSMRDPDSAGAPRDRLVAAAIRLLEEGGPETLRARRLANEVGASTMAVYTHFGGMRELLAAVAREGFARFARSLAAVPETADPLRDLFGIALAYREYAVANPQLYRVMHGLAAPGGQRLAPIDLNEVMASGRYPEGREAFGCVCRAVTRVIEAGEGTGEDPQEATSQLWSAAHGYVLLEIAGYFGTSGRGLETVLLPMAVKLFSGLGHPRESVWRSARQVAFRPPGHHARRLSWITAPLARTAREKGEHVSRARIAESVDDAVAGIEDGSTVLVGGFGLAGMPFDLVDGLIRQGAGDLTIVSNNAGNGEVGLAALLKAGRVRKVICSFPRQADSYVFDELYRAGKIELEVVPQGNLAERMRAAGAGIGAFYCPTAVGTPLADGKETREIDGRTYVLEYPIRADYAFVSAYRADTLGNLTYRKTARNFGPVMAAAARTTIVQVTEVVPAGALDPEAVVTPSIYVDRIVRAAARRYTVAGAR